MKSIVLLIFVVIIVVLIIRFLNNNYKFKFDTITHFQGSLGSGKTTMLVYHAVRWKKKKHFINQLIRIVNAISPKKIDYVNEEVYSNFPIYFGKKLGWSRIINKGFWLWEYKVPEGSLIVYDELSNDFPNTINGQAVIVDDLERFCFRWSRHALDYTAYTACQSLSSVNKNIRQIVQHCYTLMNNERRRIFRSSVNVVETFASEDIKTIYNDTDKDHDDNLFKYRLKGDTFDSRYGRNLYNLDRALLKYIASNTSKLLILMGKSPLQYWDSYTYDFVVKNLDDLKKVKL